MSKVIPNHVVRVGQTICVSSQEEDACLQHPSGCLSYHSLPTSYLYYSMDGWDRQSSSAQTKGCSLPKAELYASSNPTTEVTPVMSPNLRDRCLQEEPMEARKDNCPVSPTLDVSIENLNRLILEIDPTFQPLQLKPAQAQSPVQAIPQSNTVVAAKQEPDSPDIKYIEMSPARARCQESWQSSASPSSTALSGSPHLFPCGGTHRDDCDLSGHMTFAGGHDSGGPRNVPTTGRQSPACIQVSESISIPQGDQKNPAAYGSNSHLASSPGLEYLLKLSQHVKIGQRCSAASVLSTSPGSDTSYVLGSSTQSLSNNEPDTPQTRSTGSPSSLGSFNGSYAGSCSSGSYYPSATCSQKGNSSQPQLYQKGQTQSGSPSPIANSPSPIPIVLINGRPEESYSKDAQPTMKFVMDTSKYWFRPSITRDQAIQLLTDKLPGTFIVRDSTSYRGSFGLAMKVLGSKTGEDGGDHIRHFLIESSARGVHLKGADEEPYFGSLSAFVYQHTIMPLALPCKLVIPSQDFIGGQENPAMGSEATLPISQNVAVCNLLYLHSVTMETLTGKAAVRKAVSSTFELEILPTPTIVHFKVTEQGITLTDIQRKVFFRRHYPLASISFCDMDPENRKWQKFSRTSRIFGFVGKSPADSENICHLFAEYDAVHPASHVVDFIQKLLPAA
ncbi:tensin-4 isoform X2 [Elgaria multicarinata webbii]|uniref:tensin-4 isoform X2 n=1 Tax=Elgaria multicarinata webbii TaxID=159646 RepID=UPI002FCCDA99